MLVFSIGTLNESEKPFCRYEGDKVWVRPHTSTPVDETIQKQKASPWQGEP